MYLGNTTACRLVYWVIPCALIGWFIFGPLGLTLGVTAYLGLLISYSSFMGDNEWKHISGMVGIGIARLLILISPMLCMYPILWAFSYFGIFIGLAYYIGWTYLHGKPSCIVFPGLVIDGKEYIPAGNLAIEGCEWGEVLTGLSTGLMFDCILLYLTFNS